MRDGVGEGVRRGGVGKEGGGKRDGVQLASARLGRAGIATQGPSYAGLARIRTHSRTFWPLTLSPPQPAASAPIASRAAGQSRVPVCRPLGWHRRDSGGSDPTPIRIVCSPCEASEAVSTPTSSTMRSRSSVSESALQALRSSGNDGRSQTGLFRRFGCQVLVNHREGGTGCLQQCKELGRQRER
jgi:hypothetical protein